MADDNADRLAAAVADNADWCETVCHSLNRPTSRTRTLWSVTDPPRWYPNRISLTSQLTAPDAVAGLRDDRDCWMKDSFSALELSEHGFTPVVHAAWIHRVAQSPVSVRGYSLVASAAEVHDWALASGKVGVVTAALLDYPQVKLLSVRQGGAVVAGAALNCGKTSSESPTSSPTGRRRRRHGASLQRRPLSGSPAVTWSATRPVTT